MTATEEGREAAKVLLPALAPLADELDPESTGGAILLGVDGVCIISHGSSSSRAIVNAVRVAADSVAFDLVGKLRAAVRPPNGSTSVPYFLAGTYTRGPDRRCQEHSLPAETHVNRGPMDRQAVFELIRDRLADILEIDPSGISEGSSFGDDLGADSLALIELVESLEEELGERSVGFRIDDEDLEDLKTVRDAVDYVHAKLEAGG
jgi:acyl carrier protein